MALLREYSRSQLRRRAASVPSNTRRRAASAPANTIYSFYLSVAALVAMVSFCGLAIAGAANSTRSVNREAADDLFSNGAIHVIQIKISKDGQDRLRWSPRDYVKGSFQEGANGFTNVMVRLKGGAGSFRSLDEKPGFTIKLQEESETFHGLEKFHLNNSVQDSTYLSEWLCSELYREAGVPAARVAHAVVELNGRRLGLYQIVESIDADFLARYFKKNHGNVYSQRENADIDQPLERMGGRERADRFDLRMLAAVVEDSDVGRLQRRLPKVLDVNRFISLMAMDVILDNWDGYTFNIKNYEVYHDPETGRMVFMPHDLDQVLRDVDAPLIPNPRGMVSQAILRNPQTRAAYQARVAELAREVFVASALVQRLDAQAKVLQSGLKEYDPNLAAEVMGQIGSLKDRIRNRAKALAGRMKEVQGGNESVGR